MSQLIRCPSKGQTCYWCDSHRQNAEVEEDLLVLDLREVEGCVVEGLQHLDERERLTALDHAAGVQLKHKN